MLRNRPRLKKIFEWLIRQKIFYARGKSWLGYLDVVLSVGALSLSGNIFFGLLILIALTILSISIGHIEKKLGTWDYELDYATRLNPYFKKLESSINPLFLGDNKEQRRENLLEKGKKKKKI